MSVFGLAGAIVLLTPTTGNIDSDVVPTSWPIVESRTTKSQRKYGRKEIARDAAPPCPDDPCKGLETCDQLRARGFIYTDVQMAFQAAVKELGLILHGALQPHEIKNPDLVYHENLRWKDDPSGKKYGQPSSIIGSLCCENGQPPPKILYMYTRNKFYR